MIVERLADDDCEERRELETLFEIARTFDKHVELRNALAPMLGILEMRAGLSWGMVTLLDRETGLLKIEEADGLSAEEKERGIYRLGEGLVGRVFETGLPITVSDLSQEGRFLNRAKNRTQRDMAGKTYYCVPIRSGGAVIGTLSAERHIAGDDADAVRAADRGFLEKVSAIIADSAKLRERILEEQWKMEAAEGNYRSLRDFQRLPPDRGKAPGGESGNEEAPGGVIGEGSRIIGTSSAMRDLYQMVKQVAPSEATVLVIGDSGTGKELIAAEIKRLSRRADNPFIKINCAALPESIIESELFGHEKGAFTGASSRHVGKFEAAHTGTLFLDEIGELPPQVQVKLLRVLQEREIERVGGSDTVKVDVRVIAATNKNLEDEMKAGRFREDLFYRLNVFPLVIPPLCERKSDIVLLADHFTEKYAQKNDKLIKRISSMAIDLLTSYSWPGNVRELENCIERAVILTTDMVIHSYHLPPSLQTARSTNTEPGATLESALSRVEKEMIIEALKITEGNMSQAAARLGITERQMGLRLHHYGISWRAFRGQR
ncbi:MAG: sigma 54-interacting transcriptional regulator [Spirochaetaceae bacterium]|jgi:Nif-specific regulatory protein|nr:sigma 54-interacting transcriptional regulator [Spirochaetaceae bacterium]